MGWLPEPRLLMRSGLARRTFSLLLIAAFLPIITAAWLTIAHTNTYVDRAAHQMLTLEAKKYGLGLFQRLELAATALAAAPAGEPQDGSGTLVPPATLTPYFSSLKRMSIADRSEDPFAHELPPVGQPALRTVGDPNHSNRVALIHCESEAYCRIGLLRHDYLWQPAALAEDLHVRVSDAGGEVLFASIPQTQQLRRSTPGSEGNSAQWSLFLQQRFSAGAWTIDLLEPYSDVKLEFARYKRTLLYTLLPIVGALVLFASISIRRTHRPLEALTEATQRISSGDFRSRVVPSGDADMQALARAFNDMTRQIGQQFEMLAVLSQLDRHILGSSNLEEIVQTVLRHARGMLPCDQLGIVLFDEDCSDVGRIHIARYPDNAIDQCTRAHIPAALQERLRTCTAPIEIRGDDSSFAAVQTLIADWQSDRIYTLFSIRTAGGLRGWIVLACSASNPPARASLDVAHGLAERLAVAISNEDRQNALVRQAHYDGLTGLPNRMLLKDRLGQRIAASHRSRRQFALLFIDLDRFKNINDSFGHTSGDELLKGVAARLSEELPDVATIARLGGDEFTIITADIDGAADAAATAQAVLTALARPIMLGDIEHFVSASIGIAIYPQDGVTTDVLLRNADIAMYRAKADGPGRFAYYEEAMNREALARVELENELRHALARDELSVVYQPRVDLRDGRVIGVEALTRWHHPRFGMVPPDRFIGIAEDSGLILAIGDRVLRRACEQYHEWRRDGIDLECIAFNVSIRQLQAPGFARTLREVAERWHVPASAIEIEITESVFAADIEQLTAVLNELHEIGVRIAIDDFGTGYSSLSYLRFLPIDTLKIDRAFLPPPGDARAPAALCEAILAMSKALGLTPIAEGVESAEQAEFLRRNGCELAQGFYFSRPVSAEEITRRLATRHRETDRSAVG